MNTIYYIGGSPCSGKSTVTEILAKKYDLYYFKVDDYLDQYMNAGAVKNCKVCSKLSQMKGDQIWMRDPNLQSEEEFQCYEEMYEFIQQDLNQRMQGKDIITEGAAYFPKLMKSQNISQERYVAVIPTKDFQISHYSQREWVPYILKDCTDKERAFANWMERDALYAREVKRQCKNLNYLCMEVDGRQPVDQMVHRIELHFGLEGDKK